MCFVVTCWERADLLTLVCGVCCEFVTFPLYTGICARYASNIRSFSNQADIVMFLSSDVARQHRKARGDNITLLLYGFSNIRYYKHNTSVVSLYKQ